MYTNFRRQPRQVSFVPNKTSWDSREEARYKCPACDRRLNWHRTWSTRLIWSGHKLYQSRPIQWTVRYHRHLWIENCITRNSQNNKNFKFIVRIIIFESRGCDPLHRSIRIKEFILQILINSIFPSHWRLVVFDGLSLKRFYCLSLIIFLNYCVLFY